MVLALVSLASTVASVQTGHWFATPFAALFTVGYSYVAAFVLREQWALGAERARVGTATPARVP
jgi:hypothetical protein